MPAPVISAASSILGFRRNESFQFQPAATNEPVRWSAVGLPPGVTMETFEARSATGDAASDIITSAAHGYQNGDRVWWVSLTGGAGLSAGPVYFVRDRTTDTFKLAAVEGGAAINFTTDITAGQIRKVNSGRISGSVSTAGVWVVTISATNSASETGTRDFVIGVNSEIAAEQTTGLDALLTRIILPSGEVQVSSGGVGADGALFSLKAGDVRMLVIRFENATGARLDPDPDTLRLVLKELEPDNVILTADVFEKSGAGDTAEFFLPVDLTASGINAALSNYEADQGTMFPALAEVEWTREVTFNSAPLVLRASSPTFRVALERDLAPN
jgi:hypothetical protein